MHRVATAAGRLSASMQVNGTTMLAAADELQAATNAAMAWFRANPCPDRMLGSFVAGILNTSAEVAVAAQQASAARDQNRSEVLRRLRQLLALVDAQSQTFVTW
jgi:hypothetical protein